VVIQCLGNSLQFNLMLIFSQCPEAAAVESGCNFSATSLLQHKQ